MAKDFFYSKTQVENFFAGIKGEFERKVAEAKNAADRAATAQSTAVAAKSTADNVDARVTALESATGFGPSAPVDGQTASLVLQPGTQTRVAVSSVAASRVRDSTTLPAFATSAASDERQMTMSAPTLVDDRTIISDDAGRIVDGCQFFTMVEVGNRPGQWIDQWYGYVSGHGGYMSPIEKGYTWLVTAPTPYGPWKWHETPILGTGDRPYMVSHVVGPRCIAPDVMWVGDELWITYHGGKLLDPYTDDYDYTRRRNAPSVLATSRDGIRFTEQGIAIDIEEDVNDASPYKASTSYRRTFRDGATWHTVWQANSTQKNGVVGVPQYSMGHAVSGDGRNWVKQPPLAIAEPGDQGWFAPAVVRVQGGWLALTQYRAGSEGESATARWYFAPRLEPGGFQYLGPFTPPVRDGRTSSSALMPFFFTYGGALHVAYGGRVNPSQLSKISVAKVVWQ